MDMYNGTLASIEEGEIVKSKVLEIRDNLVVLDIGFKSEGTIPLEEFKDMPDLKPGDEVEVLLEHLEDQEGSVVLSKKKADFMRVWERIRVAYENDQPVTGTLTKKIKGGVVVDLMGVDAFLPGSQIALRRVPNIDELLGQTYDFKIIKLNKRRRNIVVSRRVILETERAGKREKLMKELSKDQVRRAWSRTSPTSARSSTSAASTACCTSPTCRGAASSTRPRWCRSARSSRSRSSTSTGTASASRSASSSSSRTRGRTSPPSTRSARASPAGRLDHELRRLHRARAGHRGAGAHQRDELDAQRPAPVEAGVDRRVDRGGGAQGRPGRGEDLARHEADRDRPVDVLPLKYPVGTRINGKVRNLTSFGAFVEIEPGIDGLIHISDMSWTKRVQHPSEVVKKGDAVDVVILNIDSENKRISLGLKQAEEDPWLRIGERLPLGTEQRGPSSA
jgi:small subunit ribosomal protein S1